MSDRSAVLEGKPAATGLVPLFEPRNIAVVGVSGRRRGLGRRVVQALRAAGFPGVVFPISKDGAVIDGQPTWTKVTGLPDVDMAIIAVPRDDVLAVVDDCISAGVKAVVVITAGFAETGPEGRALQNRLVEKVRAAGIRLIGPNCMGVMNASAKRPMNASFSPVFPAHGGLGLLSQSGALGIVILDLGVRRHVGLSTFVSIGNKADVSGNDLIEYWAADPATRVIALYLESFGNPRRFGQLARTVGRTKPIIAVKAGRTRAGSAAAGSHTASLASSDVAVAALFHQTGVIRADTIDEMFDLAACLEAQPLPTGSRVAIVTNAGGPGILAADACEAAGLSIVGFSEATRARLSGLLSLPTVGNPLDMIATAGPEQYRRAIATVLAADEVDAVIILYTPVDADLAASILEAIREGIADGRQQALRAKPILGCVMADSTDRRLVVGNEQIPLYTFPENAARALGKIVQYANWRRRGPDVERSLLDLRADAARSVCRSVLASRGSCWLTTEEAHRLLSYFGIYPAPLMPVRSPEEAASTASVLGYPVVAKLDSAKALHKTDIGGVIVGLNTPEEVTHAFDRLTQSARDHDLAPYRILLQPMMKDGIETVVGLTHDRLFGTLLGFGSGGVNVEILEDVHFRVTPASERDTQELIDESRLGKLLRGFRGRPPADIAALSDLLARVSRLGAELPEIAELDLNPVMVLPAGLGCQIVDVRIRVAEPLRSVSTLARPSHSDTVSR